MGKAFTLIELLVVVTIIVVLLSMLAPALDKAIYQAELVQCGGKLKLMGSAVTLYTFDNKKHYPDRTLKDRKHKEPGHLPINPQTVYHPTVTYDMRPIHKN